MRRHWTVFGNYSITGVWKNIMKSSRCLANLNIDRSEVVSWNPEINKWISSFSSENQFIVSLLRERIDLASHIVSDGPFDWCKVIPYRILCFIWRAKQERIPVVVALITLPVTICSICNAGEETSDHTLNLCHIAKSVMESILSWCEIRGECFTSVKDMVLFIYRWSKCRKKRSLLTVILCGDLWGI
uniref:Reverse transcriptase zinc-binding domain-containing protein n=1 Tax=Lactuca sativa TaxID=4236 RepID=A0A9R1W3H0_LACSA|nr:hypothetical protein LSAT_V11C300106730 [Lactuca sativa]